MGLARKGGGDFHGAIDSFTTVLRKQPTPRVRLELAQCYLSAGSNYLPQAKAMLTEVLADNPPEEIRKDIHAMLAMLEDLGHVPVAGMAQVPESAGHTFSGRASTGIQFDSNPRVSPSSSIVSTIIGDFMTGIKPKNDVVNTNQINLSHAYKFCNSPLSWKTDAMLYTAFYGDADDLNSIFTQVRTGLAYQNERFGSEVMGRFNHYSQDNVTEMRSWGFEINSHFIVKPNWMFMLGWIHDVKNRPQQSFRSGHADLIHFGSVFAWRDIHRLSVFAGPEFERANLKAESYNKYWANVRYAIMLPHMWEAFAGYRLSYAKYQTEEFIFGKTRRNWEHEFTAGLKKTWWVSQNKKRSLDSELSYTFNTTHSNIELFDYRRHIVNFNIGMSF